MPVGFLYEIFSHIALEKFPALQDSSHVLVERNLGVLTLERSLFATNRLQNQSHGEWDVENLIWHLK